MELDSYDMEKLKELLLKLDGLSGGLHLQGSTKFVIYDTKVVKVKWDSDNEQHVVVLP